jgi:hypothetical protein
MQKYKILFFSLLLFCLGCTGDDIPKGVMDEDKMVSLLTQIHIADGSMYNTMQLPDSLYKYGVSKYDMILKNFHTDSNQFKKSMHFYTQRPDILVKIYEQISDNLKQVSDSLNKANQEQIKKDTKRRQDSIKNLPKDQQNKVAPVVTPTTKPIAPPPPGQAKEPPKHFTNRRYLPQQQPKPNANPIK